jgi:ribosomal protein S18 acetylase RimI-like enzyme
VVVDGAALVMAESFGAGPGGSGPIAQDLGRTSGDEWDLCVVSVGDEPVATGRRYSSGGMTYLSSIATRPSWWGRGFGAAVTSALVADGRAAGTDMIYLGVETQNARAQRLYQRLGFERIGERVVDLVLA